MPVIPLGSQLWIQSHGALSEPKFRFMPKAALQPSAPHPHWCHTQRHPKVSKPGELKEIKCKIHVIHDRLGLL